MFYRGRKLRKNETIRSMIRETRLFKDDLILPIFVVEGENIYKEIPSLPNIFHYSIDKLEIIIKQMEQLGLKSCILFGIPNQKDSCGTSAYDENGIVQKAIKKIKELNPNIYVIADVCMCEYTNHGHCGILDENGYVNNDKTLKVLSKIAISYAKSGVDMIAPSDMMDGRIKILRNELDTNGYFNLPIMSYSAKYASSYYGPFREAANSAPSFGDRKSYQMDIANSKEALREINADINEGADIIMVKPALAYLDIIKEASLNFNIPICAYQVSGEYAMLKMAVEKNIMNENVIFESILAIKRAGANLIISYFALDIAKILGGE